ncbi:hypothetical protein DIPPA_09199 [Diplonema papillatum]|nr:hypothetical protein DIPPA_09199 [Diplonema papillatum]
MTSFFENHRPDHGYRVADLAASPLPIIEVLRDLYKEYNISPEDAWTFDSKLRYSPQQIEEDNRERLVEFFSNYTKKPAADQQIQAYVEYISKNEPLDKEFWPELYKNHGVALGRKWPQSRLDGAPPSRSPAEVLPPPAVMSRRESMVSRTSEVKDVEEHGSGSRRSSLNEHHSSRLSKRGSFALNQTVAPAGGKGTIIPGTLALDVLDLIPGFNPDSGRRLKEAARTDLSRAFGHPMDRTHIDEIQPNPPRIDFHISTSSEGEAQRAYSTVKSVLDARELAISALGEELRKSLSRNSSVRVDYRHSFVDAPMPQFEYQKRRDEEKVRRREELNEKLAFFHVKHAPADLNNVSTLMSSGLDEADLFKALYLRYQLGAYDGAYSREDWRDQKNQSAESRLRERLRLCFAQYEDADRIDEKVEFALASKEAAGIDEGELIKRIQAGYAPVDTARGAPTREERLRARLTEFYNKHNPSEVFKVELALQAGLSEDSLFVKLHEKYNLPPPTPASEYHRRQQQNQGYTLPKQGIASWSTMPLGSPRDGGRTGNGTSRALTPSGQLVTSAGHADDFSRKERMLYEEAVGLEARERILNEREVTLGKAAEERNNAIAIREDALREWERQLQGREQTLSRREGGESAAALREKALVLDEQERHLQARWREVSQREARLAEREPLQAPPSMGRYHEQEDDLRRLSENLDRRGKQLAEREDALRQREAGMLASPPKHSPAEAIINEQLKRLEERERVVQAKEVALMTTTMRNNTAADNRERVIDAREAQVAEHFAMLSRKEEEFHTAMMEREQDLLAREVDLNDRLNHIELNGRELLDKEAALEAQERRILHSDQTSTAISREVEERVRQVEVRERFLAERDAAHDHKEKLLNDKEVSQQQRLALELAAHGEREVLLTKAEDDLKRKDMDDEGRRRQLSALEEEVAARFRRANEREADLDAREHDLKVMQARLTDSLDDIAKKELNTRMQAEEIIRAEDDIREMRRAIERQSEDLSLRARELELKDSEVRRLENTLQTKNAQSVRLEQDLIEREGRVVYHESLMADHEQSSLLRRLEPERRVQFPPPLPVVVDRNDGLLLAQVARDEQSDRMLARRARLREREEQMEYERHKMAAAAPSAQPERRSYPLSGAAPNLAGGGYSMGKLPSHAALDNPPKDQREYREISPRAVRTANDSVPLSQGPPPAAAHHSPQHHTLPRRSALAQRRLEPTHNPHVPANTQYTSTIQADLDSIRSTLASLAPRSPVATRLVSPINNSCRPY